MVAENNMSDGLFAKLASQNYSYKLDRLNDGKNKSGKLEKFTNLLDLLNES